MDDAPESGGAADTAGGATNLRLSPSPSLFPIFPVSTPYLLQSTTSQPSGWLHNASFTAAIPASAAATIPLPSPISDSDSDSGPTRKRYDLVSSSLSEDDDKKRKKKKRKNKKRRKLEEEGDNIIELKKIGTRRKDYYFDSHGDQDNLLYGSLYRMDVARYKLLNSANLFAFNFPLFHRRRPSSFLDLEGDVDGVDDKFKSGGRYYSVKHSTLERQKGFRHIKILSRMEPIIPGEFISLLEDQPPMETEEEEKEESWDEELLRKTREFNKMSRESPNDEKVWLAFACFQDKVASKQRQKAARLQTLEKKISILEKAVDLNPGNEELLLCLLKSYQGRDSTDVLVEKWQKILMQNSDSCKLWKEFLLFCQGDFSRFKVSNMRTFYGHAIQALSSACNRLCRQGNQNSLSHSEDPALVEMELSLVDIFVSLCRFEWQTGHKELATGLFQAEIEYNLFCPSLLLSSQSKQRLFEHFWNTGGARLGEDGSVGWSTWLEQEERNRKDVLREETSDEADAGGWSGWFNPSLGKDAVHMEPGELKDDVLVEEDTEDTTDAEQNLHNDDVELLMKKLGINMDAEASSEVEDASTWKRWAEAELLRDSEQWMPLHKHAGDHGQLRPLDSDIDVDKEGDEQLSRVILFDDVSDFLFSLSSEEARYSLLSQFIDFYGGKISQWTCTNNASWIEKLLSSETLPEYILEDLKAVSASLQKVHDSSSDITIEYLLGSKHDLSRKSSTVRFLRNAILLCLNAFPRNYKLEEALLLAEDRLIAQSSKFSGNPSRGLAKILLKNDRQDVLLCGLYARSEAAYGNIDAARKVLDMALSSVDGLSPDIQHKAPLLYFWYAEMEMERSASVNNSEKSLERVLHILSCLGGNLKYEPFKRQPSGPQILKARQGYKEQIKGLRSYWSRGDVREYSIALVCAASLFETLTAGSSAGIQVIEEAFSMVLPERRTRSLQLEFLWMYYLGALLKHLKNLTFSRVWETILHGLQIYPYNPKTFTAMIKVGYLFTVPNKIRYTFDECIRRNPSVIVWLFALSYELCKPGSHYRIRGLFERALADDKMQKSVLLWRLYLAYEVDISRDPAAERRIFFRAIHACPWSKLLWLDGFQKLSSILTAKELSDLQEVMGDKELNLRTDIYEILLQDDIEE